MQHANGGNSRRARLVAAEVSSDLTQILQSQERLGRCLEWLQSSPFGRRDLGNRALAMLKVMRPGLVAEHQPTLYQLHLIEQFEAFLREDQEVVAT